MVVTSWNEFVSHKERLLQEGTDPLPQQVLMVKPDFFDVAYAINPYMMDEYGKLKKVDQLKAMQQWEALRQKYLSLGLKVNVLPGVEGLLDFVFAANQSFVFWDREKQKPAVILSEMRSEFRKKEVGFFAEWYRGHGYTLHTLNDFKLCLEGNGDALLHPGKNIIWGGAGPRTDKEAYSEITAISKKDVILLELQDPNFYHLDTCFSVLNHDTVVIYPGAFTPDSLKIIRAGFSKVIETSESDCSKYFTGNCHSPNGKDVIFQKGCDRFEAELKKAGLITHPVDTSEFMKSGGSVFCMKMMCY